MERHAVRIVLGACLLLALAGISQLEGEAPSVKAATPERVVRLEPTPPVAPAIPTAVVEAQPITLHVDLPVLSRRASADLTEDQEKELAKLEKKLAKLEKKQDKYQDKMAKSADSLEEAQAALQAAEAMPETDEKALKKKLKAIAKWQKKIAKYQGKLDKYVEKLDEVEAAEVEIIVLVEDIDPDHFADVTGLQVADQVAVVTALEDEESALLGGGSGILGSSLLGPGDFDPASAYVLDEARSHVYDPSMEVLDTVNMILCLLDQTAYDQMVNAGPYNAQIDEAACETGGDSSAAGSSSGQSSGAGAVEPSIWVVESERDTEESLHLVDFWVPQEAEGDMGHPGGTIRAHIEIESGKSEEDPFGVFDMDFAMVPIGGDVDDAYEHGYLETLDVLEGFLGFGFYMSMGDLQAEEFAEGEFAEEVQANVNMFDDQSQGVARILRSYRENHPPLGDSGVQEEEYLLAFNDQTVLKRVVSTDEETCLSRTDFESHAWRYNLYHASGPEMGQRVELESGFNVETADGHIGWAGYWGLWMPPFADVEDGDVLTRVEFGEPDPLPDVYTVLMAPGKLIRNTRQELLLADADGAEFQWTDFGGGAPPPPPDGEPPLTYKVVYDLGTDAFARVAVLEQPDEASGFGGPQWVELGAPEVIDLETYGGFLSMWSESLGGQANYVLGDDAIVYFAEEFVTGNDAIFGGDAEILLYGYDQCLKAGITAAEAETGDVFLAPSFDVEAPHVYRFDKGDMTLYLDLVPAGLAAGEEPQGGPFSWGMRSGAMVLDTSGLTGTYEIWSQPVFYTYETGPNDWNKLTLLLDDEGDFVEFDSPLQFSYEHSTENDANGDEAFAGKTFLLSYNGPGDLHGIPVEGQDFDGDGFPDRWLPLFSLADGVVLGPNGTEYALRAIDLELSLQEVPGGCTLQTVDPVENLELPQAEGFVEPDIGPKPYVPDAPAVIEGEVQTGG